MRRSFLRFGVNAGLRGVALVLVMAALAVPAYAFWTATRPPYYGVSAQVHVPIPDVPTPVKVPRYSHSVAILCYHDFSDQSHNIYTVRPQAFAAQMATLHKAGFHAISAPTFLKFLEGKKVKLPSRPMLITFDDGAKGVWRYASPILQKLGYRGTAFLITGDVGHHQPYYLDWPEVAAMQKSGIWDFGSHTSNGHGRVLIDSTGTTDPFLTNREWLPSKNRLETMDEYRTRVRSDIDQSIADEIAHGLPRPQTFAFPFSAFRTPTNDPAVPIVLWGILKHRFKALMDNVNQPSMVGAGTPSPLPRVEVYRTTTPTALLALLRTTITRGIH